MSQNLGLYPWSLLAFRSLPRTRNGSTRFNASRISSNDNNTRLNCLVCGRCGSTLEQRCSTRPIVLLSAEHLIRYTSIFLSNMLFLEACCLFTKGCTKGQCRPRSATFSFVQ